MNATNRVISPFEMELGDTVCRVYSDGWPMDWGTMIVKRLTDDSVTLWRPYGTTADFSCGESVICYMGLEEFTMDRADHFKCFALINRKKLA